MQGCVYNVVKEFGCSRDDVKTMMQRPEVRDDMLSEENIGCGMCCCFCSDSTYLKIF